jgi:hypothetical protein
MGIRAANPRFGGAGAPATLRPALLGFLFLLLFIAAPAGSLFAAQTEEGEQISTEYFTISYPKGEEKTARWYASFADDVNREVSYLLGAEPASGLTLRIYATEPDYMRANPMAEFHPGILAHAIPEEKLIGVAVERLRQQPPQLARESFRHEMTHIVAGDISNQNLPIGFHEGLAQYNELSDLRGKEVRDLINDALNKDVALLTWAELGDVRQFRRRIQVAYPQSYTVMAFLADRYGMEPFAKFLASLEDGREFPYAIFLAYNKRMDDLEKEWREYLPAFLNEGYERNVLSAHDLSHGLALLDGGRFKEAEVHYEQARSLYGGLGRTDRAEEASRGYEKARKAREADEATNNARRQLEAHEYATARDGARTAADTFTSLQLPDYAQRASDISQLAEKGVTGLAKLEEAKVSLNSLNLPASYAQAREAGEAFSQLGDAGRVGEANAVLQDLYGMQQTAGYAVLGVGGLAIGGGLLFMARRRRARRPAPAKIAAIREETRSWL